MAIVQLTDVSYTYPDANQKVLDSITLTINEGEFVGLVGPAGAGKTTLALTLTGLIPHTLGGSLSGKVLVAGRDTSKGTVASLIHGEEGVALVAMTFQDPESQIVGLTVEEDIAFALENVGVPRPEMRRRIDKVLKLLGLETFREAFPYALSGGQKQRVSIAAALALEPRILIMDEPTSELDPVGKKEVFGIVEELKTDKDLTVLMIEHEVEELVKYADRVLVLDKGRLVLDGSPATVFARRAQLETIGIRVPEVTLLGSEIARRSGWNLPTLLTEEETVEILRARGGRGVTFGSAGHRG